jgi:hypothetical protein
MVRNAVHLPVIDLKRPETVGDCRTGPRPCPWMSCRFNLLLDVLDDGSVVINAPSKRYAGAERTVADKHEFDHTAVWYVEVRLPPARGGDGRQLIYALGPLGSAERAREIATAWERDMDERSPAARARAERAAERRVARAKASAASVVAASQRRASEIRAALAKQAPKRGAATPEATERHATRCAAVKTRVDKMLAGARERAAAIVASARPVPSTYTQVYRKIPDTLELAGPRKEGALDTKFLDEAEDAIERWFDSPTDDPEKAVPSCLIDEIARLDGARAANDHEALLEEIAQKMFVSRERVRQVESMAMRKFNEGLAGYGLSIRDLREQD